MSPVRDLHLLTHRFYTDVDCLEDLLPRHYFDKRVDVVVPDDPDVPVTSPGDPGAPGSDPGNPSSDPPGNSPAIGDPNAPAGDPGSSDSNPPPIGAPQSQPPSDPAPALDPSDPRAGAVANSAKPINKLNSAISSNVKDSDVKDWSTHYDDRSNGQVQALQNGDPKASIYAKDIKLGLNTQYKEINLYSKAPGSSRSVSDALYSKDDNAIIAKMSYNTEDKNAPADKIPNSALLFKNWKDTAGSDANVKNLKYVVRTQIGNTDTQNVIMQALKTTPGALNKKVMPWKGYASWGPDDVNYKAMAGTDNGRSSFNLLANYHQELGDLKVTRIHAWLSGGDYVMALEFGH
ncbi:MAG: hypothetical protein Q9227_006318 [Pyrenula ochraceoflavens]